MRARQGIPLRRDLGRDDRGVVQRCVVELCAPMGLARGWTRDWALVRRKVWGGLRACWNQRNAIPRLRRGKQSPMRALGAGDEIDRG